MITPMKNAHFNLALFAPLTMLSVLFIPRSYADVLYGRVVGVADGDTVTVLEESRPQHKIRLMDIDAPEKKMPYGNRSKQFLTDLVFDRQVQVEYSKKDRYGRTCGQDHCGWRRCQSGSGKGWHGITRNTSVSKLLKIVLLIHRTRKKQECLDVGYGMTLT